MQKADAIAASRFWGCHNVVARRLLQIQHTPGNGLLSQLKNSLKFQVFGAFEAGCLVGDRLPCLECGDLPNLWRSGGPHKESDVAVDKVALVSGATSGIGLGVARGLVEDGWRVVICGRRVERVGELSTAHGFDGHVCDVSKPESVAEMFAGIAQRHGRLDLVFNNAGRFAPAANFGDLDAATWRDMIDTNLNGAFYVAQGAFRIMRDQNPQGGRIINNGSISAYVPRPHAASYTTSKHAITGLTKSIALDGRPYNIACGQIDIGNAATDMTSNMSAGSLQANGTMAPEPTFDVAHVIDAVRYMAGLPLSANVQFMTVMATTMPYIGRG